MRLIVLVLVVVAVAGAVWAAPVAALGSSGAIVQTTVAETSSTTAASGEQATGTSPWVLVAIGATAGAVVGVVTGLARRRRAEQSR